MAFSLKKKSQNLVGIDISSTAVKVVQLGRAGQRYRIDHYAIEPLQPGWVNDKVIVEAQSVAEAIERALKRASIKTRQAAVAVSGTGVITKIIQIPGEPGMPERDIQSQVELEASNHIPFPVDEVRMDFDVLGPAAPPAQGMLNVLLAAARNETAAVAQETVEMAGLVVEVMDVEVLALETAYSIVAQDLRIPSSEIVALFDIGSSLITLTVMHEGHGLYQRSQAFETKQLENELRQTMGVPQEEALRSLRMGDFPAGFEESVLDPFRENLCQSLERLLQYFYSSTEFNTVDKILLSGGGAGTHGLAQAMEERMGISTALANPLATMALGPGVRGQDLAADAPSLFLATGLALRSFD